MKKSFFELYKRFPIQITGKEALFIATLSKGMIGVLE